ncbi:MAG TPA: COX15/CtaA family protein [Pseudoneobacillus sp.]|nr:COX15/CtaA family protein [Pseudoneobacillus sp.]
MAIKRLAFVSIIFTYVLIVFGGYVASSNSGMGCGPDWPLCNGLFIPILKGATLIEFTHRVIGASLGLLTMILFILILRANGLGKVRNVAWGMMFLLTIQVLLGAVVVLLDTPATIVSIHLLIAMFFLYSLLWIFRNSEGGTFQNHFEKKGAFPKTLSRHLHIVMILLVLTLAFGAYIKHLSYGLACGWLECGDTFLPISRSELFQSIHRGLAMVSVVYILVLGIWSIRDKWDSNLQKRMLLAALIAIVQMLVGIITVATSLQLPWAVLHLAIGTAVFASISETQIYLSHERARWSIKVNTSNQYPSMKK